MNVVVLRGTLSSDPVERTLASGSRLLSLEVTTAEASVPVAWFDAPESSGLAAGTEVVVAGIVKRRFFRSGAATQSRTEVVASSVVVAGKRAQARKLVAAAAAQLADAS